MELTMGRDWAGYAAQYGGYAAGFFGQRQSPLGLPQGVRQAVARALDRRTVTRTRCAGHCGKSCPALGITAVGILVRQRRGGPDLPAGAGGKPKRALVTAPTFARPQAGPGRRGLYGGPLFPAGGSRLRRHRSAAGTH